MQEGLLWAGDGLAELASKVLEAAGAYHNKFGRKANRCHVHPGMLPEGAEKGLVGKIVVVADPHILPNELWIGIHEDEEQPDQACPGSD